MEIDKPDSYEDYTFQELLHEFHKEKEKYDELLRKNNKLREILEDLLLNKKTLTLDQKELLEFKRKYLMI